MKNNISTLRGIRRWEKIHCLLFQPNGGISSWLRGNCGRGGGGGGVRGGWPIFWEVSSKILFLLHVSKKELRGGGRGMECKLSEEVPSMPFLQICASEPKAKHSRHTHTRHKQAGHWQLPVLSPWLILAIELDYKNY